MGEGEPWLLLAMFGHTSIYPLLIVNLLIYSIKMICTRQVGEDTEWRGKVKGQWRAMEHAIIRRGWVKDMKRDKVYDRDPLNKAGVWEKGSPGCSLLCLVTFDYPLLIVDLIQ